MRKVLLLGTIFVATSALAFSGLVGGSSSGSKSKNYTGGVDAIGVHFGGKKSDSQPSEPTETCPADKKCGDGCCQLDNICHQAPDSGEYQCCNADLTQCCAVDQGAYSYEDWSNGYPPQIVTTCCDGQLYYYNVDAEGNGQGRASCCPQGSILHSFDGSNGQTSYTCCPADKQIYSYLPYGTEIQHWCCLGTVYEGKGNNGLDLCCDENRTIYCGERDIEGNCRYSCCSGSVTTGIGVNGTDICCGEGGTGYCKQDAEGNCINTPQCCPQGKTVQGPLEQPSGEQWYLCCDIGEQAYCTYKASYGCVYLCCNGTLYKEVGVDGADVCCREGQELTCAEEDENHNCLLQTCCSEGEIGYCDRRDSEGNCAYISCCSGSVTKGVGENGADKCCDEGSTGYCRRRDGNGNCTSASCCSGTVTKGTGSDPDTCEE